MSGYKLIIKHTHEKRALTNQNIAVVLAILSARVPLVQKVGACAVCSQLSQLIFLQNKSNDALEFLITNITHMHRVFSHTHNPGQFILYSLMWREDIVVFLIVILIVCLMKGGFSESVTDFC